MSIRDTIIRIVAHHHLSEDETANAMHEIMTGVATPAQVAAFLTAMHLKGETAAEIAGMARVMREHALRVEIGPGALVASAGAASCAGVSGATWGVGSGVLSCASAAIMSSTFSLFIGIEALVSTSFSCGWPVRGLAMFMP